MEETEKSFYTVVISIISMAMTIDEVKKHLRGKSAKERIVYLEDVISRKKLLSKETLQACYFWLAGIYEKEGFKLNVPKEQYPFLKNAAKYYGLLNMTENVDKIADRLLTDHRVGEAEGIYENAGMSEHGQKRIKELSNIITSEYRTMATKAINKFRLLQQEWNSYIKQLAELSGTQTMAAGYFISADWRKAFTTNPEQFNIIYERLCGIYTKLCDWWNNDFKKVFEFIKIVYNYDYKFAENEYIRGSGAILDVKGFKDFDSFISDYRYALQELSAAREKPVGFFARLFKRLSA